jgi:hypothetical protein
MVLPCPPVALENKADPVELKLNDTGELKELPCICNAIPVGI